MSGPRAAVARPTRNHFFTLVSSPLVKIYVGNRTEPYTLPRDLLAHYSPYFAACFREGVFKEGIEGVLRLPEEKPAFFSLIADYMRGSNLAWTEPLDEGHAAGFERCVQFIRFCDMYDICEAACIVSKALGRHLDSLEIDIRNAERQEDFRFIFSRLHEDNTVISTLSRFLARAICSRRVGAATAEFVRENTKIAGNVMKAFLEMTFLSTGAAQLSNGSRALFDNNEPSYNPSKRKADTLDDTE